MGKALLVFPSSSGPAETYLVSIASYTSGYQVQLASAVVRNQHHSYPIRIKESDIGITIQCRSVAEFDKIKKSIRYSQTTLLNQVEKGVVRFIYPDLKLDYLGFIPQVGEGVKRFVTAPILSFTFSLFRDTINTVTRQYSNTTGKWSDITGGKEVQFDNADKILKDHLPPNPFGNGDTLPANPFGPQGKPINPIDGIDGPLHTGNSGGIKPQ